MEADLVICEQTTRCNCIEIHNSEVHTNRACAIESRFTARINARMYLLRFPKFCVRARLAQNASIHIHVGSAAWDCDVG